jgi:hypothetical protein
MILQIFVTLKRPRFLAGFDHLIYFVSLQTTVTDIQMLQTSVPSDKITQRLDQLWGFTASKRVETEVKIADLSAEFYVL